MFDWLVDVARRSNLLNRSEYSEYLDFLIEVFKAIAQSDGKSEVVYPLLEANQDKLNNNLILVLRELVTAAFEQGESDRKQNLAYIVSHFSSLIQYFPLGIRANNVEIAISGYQVILNFYTRQAYPYNWARTKNNLANSYFERIRGEKAENLEKAIATNQEILKVYTVEAYPYEWARIQNNIANAYCTRIKGEQAENLETGINYYQESLKVRTFEAYPNDWAMTQGNLAIAYRMRIRGEKAENLEKAIAINQEVLKVYTFEAYSDDWARTYNNLGNAYCTRIRGEQTENWETAITCYQESLKVYTLKDFPDDWANTQNNLANAYSDRIKGDRVENLETAISHYRESLKVYTLKDFPYKWARTQFNLANAYRDRIKGERAENFETAIDYLQKSLEVFAFEKHPYEWAIVQNNLGIAYRNKIKGERVENLETAINYLQESLKVYTFKDFPYEWARTQGNLANVYLERITGKRVENLETAITYYRESLKVFAFEAYPYEWSLVQNNLGNAYRDLGAAKALGDCIFEDRKENINTAISYYQAALTINTPTTNPIRCLETSNDLGNLAFSEGNWQLAIDAYSQGIEAVENSRLESLNPQRRQEIISNAIEVYHRIVQSYLNCDRADKALEYVERSKTRNLVELLANQEIYPQGISETIKQEFDRLRRAVVGEQQRLALEEQNYNSRWQMLTSSQREQPFLIDHTHLNQLQQQLHEFIEREITPVDPDFILTQEVKSISLNEIQSLTDEKTTILEWYITGDKILAFIITADSLKVSQSSTEDLNNLINWNHEYIEKYNRYKNKENKEWLENLGLYLNNLSKILHLDEVLKLVNQKCDRLILIPHRFLHLFPLHALPLDGSESNLLCDRFNRGISYAPSCQLLKVFQNKQRPEFDRLFAIQNPTQDLIYTELEVEIIRSFFSETEVLAKQNASEANLKVHQDFPLANCIHFSCHGTFNPNSPLESALLLNKDETNQEDGKLTLGEIFELSLNHCRLVTLCTGQFLLL